MNTRASIPSPPLTEVGERGLIRRIRDRFPAPPGALHVGIGDDAAVARCVRSELQVLTTDALVEGVHFDLALSSFSDVGYKALAVNLSDVAAMGGTPQLALLSLILPPQLTVGDFDSLLDGVAGLAAAARVTVAGGNLTSSPGPLIVDVTAIGTVRPRRVLTRGGAKPGDVLYVSGAVGAGRAGLGYLRAHRDGIGTGESARDPSDLIERYRRPAPRTRLGALLGRTRTASACMDLSDGLADGIMQLAGASGTGAVVDASALPIPAAATAWFHSQGQDPIHAALAGGDDYELLFAVPPGHHGRLRTVRQQARGVTITRIGELTGARSLLVRRGAVVEPLPEGFTHF